MSGPGQEVEVTFKFMPGHVYIRKVGTILQAIASGQTQMSSTAVPPKLVQAAPLVVRMKPDDDAFAQRLPEGAIGTAATFTDHVSHVIRRVLLRQVAMLNYIKPF